MILLLIHLQIPSQKLLQRFDPVARHHLLHRFLEIAVRVAGIHGHHHALLERRPQTPRFLPCLVFLFFFLGSLFLGIFLIFRRGYGGAGAAPVEEQAVRPDSGDDDPLVVGLRREIRRLRGAVREPGLRCPGTLRRRVEVHGVHRLEHTVSRSGVNGGGIGVVTGRQGFGGGGAGIPLPRTRHRPRSLSALAENGR